jgi:hypothetical protein
MSVKRQNRTFPVGVGPRLYKRVFTHGIIPGSSHTQALGISSPRTDEAHLMGPCNDGETQWNAMPD